MQKEKSILSTKETSPYYVWGESCESWMLHHSGNLVVKAEKMLPNTSEQLHYHEKAKQFFYILKGQAVFTLEENIFHVTENQGISIEPSQKHKISNMSSEDLEFLVISTSPTEQDRILI